MILPSPSRRAKSLQLSARTAWFSKSGGWMLRSGNRRVEDPDATSRTCHRLPQRQLQCLHTDRYYLAVTPWLLEHLSEKHAVLFVVTNIWRLRREYASLKNALKTVRKDRISYCAAPSQRCCWSMTNKGMWGVIKSNRNGAIRRCRNNSGIKDLPAALPVEHSWPLAVDSKGEQSCDVNLSRTNQDLYSTGSSKLLGYS